MTVPACLVALPTEVDLKGFQTAAIKPLVVLLEFLIETVHAG